MIFNYLGRHSRAIAWFLLLLIDANTVWCYPIFLERTPGFIRFDSSVNTGIPAKKSFAWSYRKGFNFYESNGIQPNETPKNKTKKYIGGPTQPEMQAFQSVNANNMVDLFSGDFSYNIPLMDVGGYPVNLSYRSGISMDQEASWVGLGWNINPGAINRNMRGLPDDFDGSDSIKKITSIKCNKCDIPICLETTAVIFSQQIS